MYYIVGLKNALHVIQRRPMESLPAYISHELQGASLTQQRTYHENCTIRMLCQVVEGLSGVESKIQLLEQGKFPVCLTAPRAKRYPQRRRTSAVLRSSISAFNWKKMPVGNFPVPLHRRLHQVPNSLYLAGPHRTESQR